MIIYVFIASYTFIVVLFYILVVKRMKYLSKRHVQNTWIDSLEKGYKIVQRRMNILITALLLIIILLFLVFIKNEILWERWLHIGEKALDNNVIQLF